MPYDLNRLEHELMTGGLKAGLAWLNTRVAHRFTAVSLLKGDMLNLVELVDKHNGPATSIWRAAPLKDSFCQFSINNGMFISDDTLEDERLQGNIYREVLRCYVGLPVHRRPGDLLGTFCHFDFEPRQVSADEFAFLQDAVTFLSPYVTGHEERDDFHIKVSSGNSGFSPL